MLSEEEIIGPVEAARLLRIGPTTVQRWIDSGLIPAHKTAGHHRRIVVRDLVEFAKTRGIPLHNQKSSTPPTVLIVDDDHDLLDMFSVRIRGERPDLTVQTASNGFQAGFMISQHSPGLVLLDIRMPGLSGIDVCRLVKKNPLYGEMRIVGMTAFRDHAVDSLIAAGAEEVLHKPVELRTLQTVLNRYIPLRSSSGGGEIRSMERRASQG